MKFGIVPNIYKENISEVVRKLIEKLEEYGFSYIVSDVVLEMRSGMDFIPAKAIKSNSQICSDSDVIVSIGGDGTMLHTAYIMRNSEAPIFGANIGRLGFLAELDITRMDEILSDIKNGNFEIENRMALEAESLSMPGEKMFAVNDIVIDKGGWAKMIEISITVNNHFVSEFPADGLILATPTGSTGYSMSVGGPVVSPRADVITLSPISPHSLTIRPLVLSSMYKIYINVHSQHSSVQVSCDGQRVYQFVPPAEIVVYKSDRPVKLLHTFSTNYFKILREKLFWGVDARTK
jgi:NAD+ kinase